MPNRLAHATSPYLQQHADNPVDWWEWTPDAFAEAQRRNVPILLSIGYAACHWCHVMAHESFEDHDVAEALNDGFVAIKVDREERPDVDAVYMDATQALTGQGGWPMTCLLTPTGEPFFAGTYLPQQSFLTLLANARNVWTQQRDQVLASASGITAKLHEITAPPQPDPIDAATLDDAAHTLATEFDHTTGGFGGAPKFPPSMVLEFLLRHHARTSFPNALAIVTDAAHAMARGGIYDQLAGGFARYSVDANWVVPHFEKMLYDNAQLLRVYAHLHATTGDPLARRVAIETAEFLRDALLTDEGLLASSLDADTIVDGPNGPQNIEGATYVWTPTQLTEVLGPEHGPRAADLLAVTATGTFEHGTSTLQLPHDPPDATWWSAVRTRLRHARDTRPQPARDDKAVTSWNGLAIAALAEAGSIVEHPWMVDLAQRIATAILETHLVDGHLRRSSRDGVVGDAHAVLDDHGNLAEGLVALHRITGGASWLESAGDIVDTAIARFRDPDSGQWYDTPHDAPPLYLRPHGQTDNAEPSGLSAIAGALLAHGHAANRDDHVTKAQSALAAAGRLARQSPRFAGWHLATAEAALNPHPQAPPTTAG